MRVISAHLARQARRALRPLLQHRYSRYSPNVPVVPAADDAEGNPVVENSATTSDLPCLYQSSRRLLIRSEGPILVDVPTLTVYHDDDLAVGDRIVSVTDREGTILVSSASVESFDPAAEAGASVLKIGVLRMAEAAG